MRAQQVSRLEGPEGLDLVELPEPDPGEGVLLDVVAAGVSFPDLLMTQGRYQVRPPLPFVPGVEVAGVVRRAPPGGPLAAGDRVAAFTGSGGFAEVVVAPADRTFPIPDAMSFESAAGLVLNYHTAHFALHRRGRLARGETVVVHGAAGGVGTASVQVARGAGARVLAVVGDDAKAEVARRAGAAQVLRSDEDWVQGVSDATGGRGADVVVDPVGGERFSLSLRCLAPEGRLLVVGFTSGTIPEVAANRLLLRNIDVVGVAWGAFLTHDPSVSAAIVRGLGDLIERGVVDPIVGSVHPFEDAAGALRELEQRRATGKVVLRVREPPGG